MTPPCFLVNAQDHWMRMFSFPQLFKVRFSSWVNSRSRSNDSTRREYYLGLGRDCRTSRPAAALPCRGWDKGAHGHSLRSTSCTLVRQVKGWKRSPSPSPHKQEENPRTGYGSVSHIHFPIHSVAINPYLLPRDCSKGKI